jgi:hypothetical protein
MCIFHALTLTHAPTQGGHHHHVVISGDQVTCVCVYVVWFARRDVLVRFHHACIHLSLIHTHTHTHTGHAAASSSSCIQSSFFHRRAGVRGARWYVVYTAVSMQCGLYAYEVPVKRRNHSFTCLSVPVHTLQGSMRVPCPFWSP